MTSRRARLFGFLLLGTIALPFGVTAAVVDARSPAAVPTVPRRAGSLPIVAEHRYRMAAKIRPLLLFWIGRDNVGGARVVWRRGQDGAVGFELLIGSDPARAPRRINRWGYISEEVRGSEARLLGVMKQSNEQSLEEAKSRLTRDAQQGRYVFKAIQATVASGEARADVTTIHLTQDLTYREIETLLKLIASESGNAISRRVRLPRDTRPGFLAALAELVNRSVDAHSRRSRQPSAEADAIGYVYNGTFHDLRLREVEFIRAYRLGDRRYGHVLRGQFESRNRATGEKTRFELAYGANGPLAEIPVHAVYQPRWWFQVELFLDEADQP